MLFNFVILFSSLNIRLIILKSLLTIFMILFSNFNICKLEFFDFMIRIGRKIE